MPPLNDRCPTTIRIIGSVGSGKTTLARKISAELNIPHYELDNVVWRRTESGDIRRSDAERDEYLAQILNSGAWIIEGAHHQWGLESFQRADMILFLDVHCRTRLWRIVKRFLRQRLGIEKANYKPTFHMLKMMFVWTFRFEREDKFEIHDILRQHQNKLVVLPDNVDVAHYLVNRKG